MLKNCAFYYMSFKQGLVYIGVQLVLKEALFPYQQARYSTLIIACRLIELVGDSNFLCLDITYSFYFVLGSIVCGCISFCFVISGTCPRNALSSVERL